MRHIVGRKENRTHFEVVIVVTSSGALLTRFCAAGEDNLPRTSARTHTISQRALTWERWTVSEWMIGRPQRPGPDEELPQTRRPRAILGSYARPSQSRRGGTRRDAYWRPTTSVCHERDHELLLAAIQSLRCSCKTGQCTHRRIVHNNPAGRFHPSTLSWNNTAAQAVMTRSRTDCNSTHRSMIRCC